MQRHTRTEKERERFRGTTTSRGDDESLHRGRTQQHKAPTKEALLVVRELFLFFFFPEHFTCPLCYSNTSFLCVFFCFVLCVCLSVLCFCTRKTLSPKKKESKKKRGVVLAILCFCGSLLLLLLFCWCCGIAEREREREREKSIRVSKTCVVF